MGWKLDKSHSEVGFSVRHMMISKVRGKFTDYDAEVELDPARLESLAVKASVDVASITTGEAQRDGHLKSPDFFDAAKYPKMTFQSTGAKVSGSELSLSGELTIAGRTQPVVLHGEVLGPSKDPWGMQRVGFSLTGELDREDFGLTWNQALEAGGVLVGKKVALSLEVELVAG